MGICYEIKEKNISEAKNREICANSINPVNLLKAVKSKYILVDIFERLYITKKLDIIFYNKKLQNIIGINLDDYKKISGKIFKGERNGKGKEYGSIDIFPIFEGKYLNGKRNGKGK